ncbi:endonuclease 8-like 3 isoform X2 [Protopterus annectens]|uniref:endonuclease 8-like 3 isoform X2 n=1 Tax=Protopterus annectens TaxID=7888 RepID=UPI001CFA0F52|nr:endonuclease 8-like 3 isoform X2 [Protopterus annectens]
MVEGPGCTLNGEKIRSRVRKGQLVKDVRGTAVSVRTPPANGERIAACRDSFGSLKGNVFCGVETLGKELFLYFGSIALRVHFGMNGSIRINPVEKNKKSGTLPILEVHLTVDAIFFFDASVEIRCAAECEQKVRAMEELDICSSKFSFTRAEDTVKRQRDRMLCDVLLDQAVLPGVGNIIKNEALFDSGLHPAVKVCQLSDEQVHHLVKMTRDFTVLFYKCRKTGAAIYKHFKVYKHPKCSQCKGSITVCRLGENNRMTYFCSFCQKIDPRQLDISKLPSRNSLIGWAYGGGNENHDLVAKKEEEEWTCILCTLINKPSVTSCEACLTPRPEDIKPDTSEDLVAFNSNLVKFPCNNFSKPQMELKLNRKTAFGTTTLVLTDLSNKFTLGFNESPASLTKNSKQLSEWRAPYDSSATDICTVVQNYPQEWRTVGQHSLCTANRADNSQDTCRDTDVLHLHSMKKMKMDCLPSGGKGYPGPSASGLICTSLSAIMENVLL